MPLQEIVFSTLDNLPRSPVLDRAAVVDTLLDMLSATEHPGERSRLEHALTQLPSSVVVDRSAVADLLLDLLGPGEPSAN